MKTALVALTALLLALPAEAGPRHRHGGGSQRASAGYRAPRSHGYARARVPTYYAGNPWAYGWAPPYRAGWNWVVGGYDRFGYWRPGYWVPGWSRPGFVWAPGYWLGNSWVEGYWRSAYRPGFVWVDGCYGPGGAWTEGHWQGDGGAVVHEPDDDTDALEREVEELRDEVEALREALDEERREDGDRSAPRARDERHHAPEE
jgi:hypothetical protein